MANEFEKANWIWICSLHFKSSFCSSAICIYPQRTHKEISPELFPLFYAVASGGKFRECTKRRRSSEISRLSHFLHFQSLFLALYTFNFNAINLVRNVIIQNSHNTKIKFQDNTKYLQKLWYDFPFGENTNFISVFVFFFKSFDSTPSTLYGEEELVANNWSSSHPCFGFFDLGNFSLVCISHTLQMALFRSKSWIRSCEIQWKASNSTVVCKK